MISDHLNDLYKSIENHRDAQVDTSNPREVVGLAIPACAFGEEQRNAAWAMTVAIDEGHPKESKRWKKSIPTSHYRMGPHS